MRAFDRAQTISAYRFRTPPLLWKLQRFLSIGEEGELKGHIETLNKLFTEIVQTRLEQITMKKDTDSLRDDFLTLFIHNELSQGRQPSVRYLRDIIASFLIAGRGIYLHLHPLLSGSFSFCIFFLFFIFSFALFFLFSFFFPLFVVLFFFVFAFSSLTNISTKHY